ncbi:MAG: Trypsin, partial [Pseudomonadota bacterium]
MKLNKIMLINMLVTLGFISSCNGGSSKSDQVNSNSLTPSATKPQNSLVIKNGVPVRSFELNGLIPLIKVKTRRGYHLCTGVVVAPNKILTAAHCVMKLHDKVVDQYFESQDLYAAKKIVVIFPKEVDRPINLTIDSRKNWIRYKARVVYVKS